MFKSRARSSPGLAFGVSQFKAFGLGFGAFRCLQEVLYVLDPTYECGSCKSSEPPRTVVGGVGGNNLVRL